MLTNHSLSEIGRGTVGYHGRFNRRSAIPYHRDLKKYSVNYPRMGTLPADLPVAPPGYEWVYEVDGLSGLGKFRLKKIFKKIAKVVKKVVKVAGKVVKKVAPVALVAAGVYYSAPWFKALASKVGIGTATGLLQNAPEGEISEEQAEAEASSGAFPAWIAGAATAALQIKMQKEAAAAALQAQREAGEAEAQAARAANQAAIQQQREQAEVKRQIEMQEQQTRQTQPSGLPQWLIPAVVGGAALLLSLKS